MFSPIYMESANLRSIIIIIILFYICRLFNLLHKEVWIFTFEGKKRKHWKGIWRTNLNDCWMTSFFCIVQDLEPTVVSGQGTETGQIIATTVGGRNGQPKQVNFFPLSKTWFHLLNCFSPFDMLLCPVWVINFQKPRSRSTTNKKDTLACSM